MFLFLPTIKMFEAFIEFLENLNINEEKSEPYQFVGKI